MKECVNVQIVNDKSDFCNRLLGLCSSPFVWLLPVEEGLTCTFGTMSNNSSPVYKVSRLTRCSNAKDLRNAETFALVHACDATEA